MRKNQPFDPNQRDFLIELASLARQDAYAARNKPPKNTGYTTTKSEVDTYVIERHLRTDPAIAVYPLQGDQTRIGVIDIDDHDGRGEWGDMLAAGARVASAISDLGFKCFAFRSGGGNGLHIWTVFRMAQPAWLVRQMLSKVLETAGLQKGTGGLRKGEAEVFPAQDKSTAFGNPIALPLARSSCQVNDFVEGPPLASGSIDAFLNEDIDPSDYSLPSARPASSVTGRRPVSRVTVEKALTFIDAADYHTWIKIGFALKAAYGEEVGFEIWNDWSASADNYDGEDSAWKKWRAGLNSDGRISIGSLFYLAKQGGWRPDKNEIIDDLNQNFVLLTAGNRARVIVQARESQTDALFVTLGRDAFFARMNEHPPVAVGEGKFVPLGQYWWSHQRALRAHRVVFQPNEPPGFLHKSWNVWRGFGVEPKAGDASHFYEHVYDVIADGNEEIGDWILNWMALGIQQPDKPIGTAPVLIGGPGTGKSLPLEMYASLWGDHAVSITSREHVSGRFNQHLFGKRFVLLDEGLFAGDKAGAQVVKARITQPTLLFEAKGYDPIEMPNRLIFAAASNYANAVLIDPGERRWMVMSVSDKRQEDAKYFTAFVEQMESGGKEALLHDLIKRDLSKGPDPRRIIRTGALTDAYMACADPIDALMLGLLNEGWLPGEHDTPSNETTAAHLFDYFTQSNGQGRFINDRAIGRRIKETFPSVTSDTNGYFKRYGRSGTRTTRYIFPSLWQSRREFARRLRMNIDWPKLEDWQSRDADQPVHDTEENPPL
jgi:hypothetical protein